MKKFFKIAIVSCMVCFMGLVASACSLFGGGDNKVTESQWSAAFAYDEKYVLTMTSTYGTGSEAYIVTVDGNKVKVVESQNESYLNFDGTTYWLYYKEDGEWYKLEIEQENYIQMMYKFSTTDLPFDEFEYNSDEKGYTAENLTVMGKEFDSVIVRFDNLKLKEILLEDEQGSYKMEYSFGNASVTLPQIEEQGGGVSSEGVTEQVWNNALNFGDVTKYAMTQETPDGTLNMYKDVDDVYKLEGEAVGGEVYMYFDGTDYWGYMYNTSTSSWAKVNIGEEAFNQSIYEDMSAMFPFASFEYDQTNDVYRAENLSYGGGAYDYVTVKFVNNVITEVVMVEGTSTATVTFDYSGNFSLELPQTNSGEEGGDSPIEGAGEVTDEEWANALAYNGKYVMTTIMGVYGTISVYVDENTIKEVMTFVGGFEEEIYMHFDGTKYWNYFVDLDTKNWVKEEMEDPSDFNAVKLSSLGLILDKSLFTYDSEKCAYVSDSSDYFQSATVWVANSKIAKIKLIFDDATSETITLDYAGEFVITLPIEE